ncbi:hypothetical protein [Arsenicicoccus piscis]|uniref:ABC transporter n=1 Tax=Arsenicicoccus piscis TaxID=673954 RepID=A0ABQ6HJN1_9MICO|nr:hypothetical protein GCM10025862_06790 [Arsenicicoccus piscis]
MLDRVPREAIGEVREHLSQMLTEQRLENAPLFTVAEATLDADGRLPASEVDPIRSWLTTLAQDALARQVVVRKTLSGALDSLDNRVALLVTASRHQQDADRELRSAARAAYADAGQSVEEGMSDGTLLRGEVLARWQEFVGTGEFLRSVEAGIGRLRDRITAAVKGTPPPTQQLGDVLQSGVATLVQAQADRAASDARRAWRSTPGGAVLLTATPALAGSSPDLPDRIDRLVRDWQGDLLQMVRDEGQDRRTTARVLAYGVNGLAVVLMLVVFSQTAGLSGGEIGIAGGSAVLAQRILEAVFGDQAVRELAKRAKANLLDRVEALYAAEERRFDEAVTTVAVPADQQADLATAQVAVKAAR